ncbi:hypothetical protein E2C01_056332 [Portunus trituberculatus]|uniref:Uncharacterized protein n=1 Tax=Portunus trituberculatus TaxID=210409 RepID=A0A5B7GXG7_PORTR|nr:hypothetical protein [Portunus trituberculatus]
MQRNAETKREQYRKRQEEIDSRLRESLKYELCSIGIHGLQKCSGLPFEAFKTIVKCSKHGTLYVSIARPLNRPHGVSKPPSGNNDLPQLFEIVKALSHGVSTISNETRNLKNLDSSNDPTCLSDPSLL